MSSLMTYSTILGEAVQIVTPAPTASGGLALNNNFKALSDGILYILNAQAPYSILAGPASGTSYGSPTFRPLGLSDLPTGVLKAANNLSDVANTATAATNLGLGSLSSVTFGGVTLSGSGTINVAGGKIVDGSNTVYGSGSVYAGQLSTAPSSPTAGQMYFNTASSHFEGYNGSAWTILDNTAGTSGSTSLNTSYTTTTSWAATGLAVTLPNAGTYLVTMIVRCYSNAASAYMSLRLYNSTDSAVISNSTIFGAESTATGSFQATVTAMVVVTTTGANKTIQLQAIQNSGSGTVVDTNSSGGTYLNWVQLT